MKKRLKTIITVVAATILVAPLIGLIVTGYAIGWGPFAELRYYNKTCYKISDKTYSYKRESLTIQGKNGNIACQFYKVDSGEEKRQIAILSHGFATEMWHNINTCVSLANAGINVLMFDYCGGSVHSKSDLKTTEMSILTERQDLNDVIDYVKALDSVDTSKISLIGYSQGGLVAGITARDRNDIYKLCLYYPAFMIVENAKKQYKSVDEIPEVITMNGMTIGKKYYEDIINFDCPDVYEYCAAYTNPTLLIHGTADESVDYQVSVKANEKYSNSNLVTIEGGAHGFVGDHDVQAVQATYDFLIK